nr:retrovirus-related Pol polyprotein from transposon TNT 1-94 [Tanacetum cinerariifolium]
TKVDARQDVKKDVSSLRYIVLPNWVHEEHLESTSMETPIPTVSSLVPTVCFTDSQEPSSETRLISKRVTNQAETPSLDNILTLTNRFEDILGVTSNEEESNGVEADVSNMETTITASPTPTLRIHKDHLKSQIIGHVDTLIQTRNKSKEVWSLVDCPKGVRPIGTKWVLKNKKDERGIVIRNKARLVAQGHTQKEGIDYDEVFAPVARIEAIRLFLAYASFMGFIVYQMDVKSAFLYGIIDEEVYVMEPPRFQDPEYPARVYKVEKAMYGLHQALRAWHQVTPKEFHLHAVKRIFRYLKGHPKVVLWYSKDSPFDLVAYSYSDYGGATQDRKSTTGGCQFLGRRLILWKCKKQTIVATSTTEAEYVVAASFCGQVLWIQNQLLDYGLSMPYETLSKEISTSILRLLYTAKTFDLVWIWLGGDYGNVFLNEKGEHNTDFHPMVDFLKASPLSPSFPGRIVPFFDTMLIRQGEGSETPTEPHHTPSQKAQPSSHTHISSPFILTVTSVPTIPIPTVIPSETTPIRQYIRRARIAQSSAFPPVADEPTYPLRDVSQREACPTYSGFIADHERETIDKSSTLPHDSAPRVTSPAADEGSMQHTIPELTALCTSLQRQLSELTDKFQAQEVEINRLKERVKQLEEREGVAPTNSGDDAPIKGRSMDEGEAATERVSDNTKEMATVLTSMDAATVLASGVVDVPTGSGSIPTVSTPTKGSVPTGSEEVLTVSPVFATATVVTPVTRRNGKEKEDQRRAEQIARYAEIARIHAEEELQSWKVKDFMGMTFEEVDAKFNSVCKQMEDFIPMGSKEEAEKIKRKEGQRNYWKITRLGGSSACYQFFIDLLKHLDREDLKQLWRLVKEILCTRPPTSDKEIELWVELSRLYEPDEEDQLWTHTQNFMHAPVDWKLYDSCRMHHVSAKDKEIFILVEKDYPLRKGLALVMICYKLQVDNFSKMANELVLKI